MSEKLWKMEFRAPTSKVTEMDALKLLCLNHSSHPYLPGTVLQYSWVCKSDFMCCWSPNSLSRSCAGFSCRGSKDSYPACKIGVRHFCSHGVSLRVPLHAQGTQTLSCAFSHNHFQIMHIWVYVPLVQALKLAGGHVLEPVMALEVTVDEEYLSPVLADLAQRRGTVCDIQSRQDNKVLLATVPLAEMMVSLSLKILHNHNVNNNTI